MRILWLPHTPSGTEVWEGSRQYHLFRHLSRRHELHWITWNQSKRLTQVPHWGKWAAKREDTGTAHRVVLAPNFYHLLTKGYPRPHHLALNQCLFRRATDQIARDVRPDVLVYSSSHHFTGFPSFRLAAPLVFDYVDGGPAWVEAAFIRASAAVVTVSPALAAAASSYGKPAFHIPNGVDLERYRSVGREQAKRRLGVDGLTVISLIGLTCSPRLYFLEAVAALQAKRTDLLLLVIGEGKMRQAIVRRARELGIRSICAPGHVCNQEVHWYFAASDVGLYPGEDIPYYRQAAPLKIVEYSAAGAQVVSTPVDMFRRGWPNVVQTQATAAHFEQAILAALRNPMPPPDLSAYDWPALVQRFEAVLKGERP